MISLTKVCRMADLEEDLKPLVDQYVDPHFGDGADQHPVRRWEYAMALLALRTWAVSDIRERTILDVGGAGSPLRSIVQAGHGGAGSYTVIDPAVTYGQTVENYRGHPANVVFSISTYEHTTQPLAFLEACARMTKPGGLLFLTFDYHAGGHTDTYHFHWMRERIVSRTTYGVLIDLFTEILDFDLFGEFSDIWHGPQLYDYSVASLALQRRP